MSLPQLLRVAPFLGPHTALHRRYVDRPYGRGARNTRYEDGALEPLYGFRNIVGAQRYKSTAMDALKLFKRAQGVVDGVDYSTYVSVERYGSDTGNFTRLMTVDTVTGARQKVLRDMGDDQVDDLHLGGATGGTFKITVEGQQTAAIDWNADPTVGAASVRQRLEDLSNVAPGDVTVAAITGGYRITWGGAYANIVVAVSMNSASLTGTTTTPVLLTSSRAQTKSEVSQILLGGATGGSYTLTFYSQVTAAIAWNATAAQVKAALEALSNVNPGDVTVSAYANGFYVFWGGRYLGDNLTAPTLTDSTTGGTGASLATVTNGHETNYLSDGTSAVPVLADSYYGILVFLGTVYGFNYAAGQESGGSTSEAMPLWKFTLGDAYSFEAVAPPAEPDPVADQATVKYRRRKGSDTLGYLQFNWSGMVNNATDRTLSGLFSAASNATGVSADVTVTAPSGGAGAAGIEFILATATGGNANQDFEYGDCLKFTMQRSANTLVFDLRSVQVYLKDTNGVRVDLDTRVAAASADTLANLEYFVYAVFPPGKTNADWATTKHLGIEMNITAGAGGEKLNVGAVTIGGMPGLSVPNRDWLFEYAWKNSTTGLVSGASGGIVLPWQALRGDAAWPAYLNIADPPYMGVVPTLTLQGSTESGVDKTDIVLRQELPNNDRNPDQRWGQRRLVDEVTMASPTTYVFHTVAADFGQKPAFTQGVFQYDDIVGAATCHGYVQWLFRKGNKYSVRDSAVGEPLNLVNTDNSDLDILDPLDGANWILADSFNDEGVVSVPLPGGVALAGKAGVYVQMGMTPLTKTPFSRLPGSVGCCGRNSVKSWRTEQGDPAVVFVSANADAVYIVPAFAVADRDKQFRPDEETIVLRGSFRDWLLQGSTSINTDRMNLEVDYHGDALWVVYVDRAVVLRRKSLMDGTRQWELYRYNLTALDDGATSNHTWLLSDFSEGLGLRAMRINGAMDELEYDTSNSWAPIVPTWHTPSSTNTTTKRVEFDGSAGHTDPAWATGYAIVPRKTAGGLTRDTTVYARAIGSGVYEFYDTYAHAVASPSTTGRKNLTASIGELSAGRFDGYKTLGADAGYTAYWQSGEYEDGGWGQVVSTVCDRENLDDCPTIGFYGDRSDIAGARTDEGGSVTGPVQKTHPTGKRTLYWPKWLRNRVWSVEIVLSENSSQVVELEVKRVPSQSRRMA